MEGYLIIVANIGNINGTIKRSLQPFRKDWRHDKIWLHKNIFHKIIVNLGNVKLRTKLCAKIMDIYHKYL